MNKNVFQNVYQDYESIGIHYFFYANKLNDIKLLLSLGVNEICISFENIHRIDLDPYALKDMGIKYLLILPGYNSKLFMTPYETFNSYNIPFNKHESKRLLDIDKINEIYDEYLHFILRWQEHIDYFVIPEFVYNISWLKNKIPLELNYLLKCFQKEQLKIFDYFSDCDNTKIILPQTLDYNPDIIETKNIIIGLSDKNFNKVNINNIINKWFNKYKKIHSLGFRGQANILEKFKWFSVSSSSYYQHAMSSGYKFPKTPAQLSKVYLDLEFKISDLKDYKNLQTSKKHKNRLVTEIYYVLKTLKNLSNKKSNIKIKPIFENAYNEWGKLVRDEKYQRRHTGKYYKAREVTFSRDKFICRKCNKLFKDGKGLHAHHLLSAENYPDLFLRVDNLVTLCNDCHIKIHATKDKEFIKDE